LLTVQQMNGPLQDRVRDNGRHKTKVKWVLIR
jgi:hypothetical protein